MDERTHSDGPSQSVHSIENLVLVKWKPKYDQSMFIMNEKRVLHSISGYRDFEQVFVNGIHPYRLEFHEIDLTNYPRLFWETYGAKIESLKFSFCVLGLNTVSNIMKYCTMLDTFGLRVSDSFVETQYPSFSGEFECLAKQGIRMATVRTLSIHIHKSNPTSRCQFDETIFNLLQIFCNFQNLTLKHNCNPDNFKNYSSPDSLKKVIVAGNRWSIIFDLVKKRSPDLERLNVELSSFLQVSCVWYVALNRRIFLKEYRLTELTIEMAPAEKYSYFKGFTTFLKHLKCLKTIVCKLLHMGFSIDSIFLNKFFRDVVQKCLNLVNLVIEYHQTNEVEWQQWDISFELLRDILNANLTSLRIHMDCCVILFNSNKDELGMWRNDTIESLSLSYTADKGRGKQYETVAAFISILNNLNSLHLSGNMNDAVLKSIWIHQNNLKNLSLGVFNSSFITEAGFIVESAEMCNSFFEDEDNVEDLSENLEYLKIELRTKNSPLENELKLPSSMFQKFSEFKNLRYISFKTNTSDDADLVIKFGEQLLNFKKLENLFIECSIKELHISFLYNICAHCKHLERIGFKNNHTESKSFSVFEYKEFFRYCTSLKLLIHESGRTVNRWFKENEKNLAAKIPDDEPMNLILTDVNDDSSEFWFS